MKAKQFLENWVVQNKRKLGIQEALYEYHEYSETHFLKVLPSSVVETPLNDLHLSHLIIEFEERFKGELLCLLSSDSLTQLEMPMDLVKRKVTAFEGPLHNNIFFTVKSLDEYTIKTGNNDFDIDLLPSINASSVMVDLKSDYSLRINLIKQELLTGILDESSVQYGWDYTKEDSYPQAA